MTSRSDNDRTVALSLMRMALALLDRCRESTGTARLQHVIDTVEGRPIEMPGDSEIDRLFGPSLPR